LQALNESLNRKEKIADYMAQLIEKNKEDEDALLKKAIAEKEVM
jgi:hypothetical protein